MADQDLGVVLIVLGAVLMVVVLFFLPICALGFVLLIIGIVLAATAHPTPQYYYPAPAYGAPGYGVPGAPPGPYAPQAPAPGQAAAGPTAQQPTCYVCGTPLTWVPQYGRWYCTRCSAYR